MSIPTEDIIREISGMNGDISFNFGAVRRFDGKGFVVCFGKDAETVDKKITPENMLVGYQVAMDGTVIITDGSRVIAANDESFQGMAADECPFISKLDLTGVSNCLGKPKVLLRFCSSTFGYYVCYFVTSFAKSPFSAAFPAKKLSALESVVFAIALSASAVRNA